MPINIYASGAMMKHVGLVGDKRCVIVLQLPEEKDKVHVIDTDALPDQYHQSLMSLVQSKDAQESVWLADILGRRTLQDGSNALRTFYDRGYVQIVPVERVKLSPRPNQHIPLSQMINYMNGTSELTEENFNSGVTSDEAAQAKMAENETAQLQVSMENQLSAFENSTDSEKTAAAKNLLVEANLLQTESNRKAELAYSLDPSLRPVESTDDGSFVDEATGKSYKTEAALKAAVTRRNNK